MQKLKSFNRKIFVDFSNTLSKKIESLSKNELISFVKVLNESEYDYQNKNEIKSLM